MAYLTDLQYDQENIDLTEPHFKPTSKPIGGVFSPKAQYPCAVYTEVFSTARDTFFHVEDKLTQTQGNKITIRTKESMAKGKIHSFNSALLLVDTEGNARMDKKTLRDVGIEQVQVLTSGLLAARYLSTAASEKTLSTADIIISHAHFEDMPALQWIELMRSHPLFKNIPILGIASDEASARMLGAFANGFTKILIRPFSQDDLNHVLEEISITVSNAPIPQVDAMEMATQSVLFKDTLKRLESYQGEGGRATKFVQEGLQLLKEQEFDKAVIAFKKALYNQEMKGEAEFGLAAAWKGKKNIEKHCYYLSEACLSLVRSQKFAKARMAYNQLLKIMPKAENPFVIIADQFVRSQKYKEAAGFLVLGLPLGNGEHTAKLLAKTCYYSENPQFVLGKIIKAFTATALQPIVKELPKALKYYTEKYEVEMQSLRDKRSVLQQKAKTLAATQRTAFAVTSPKSNDGNSQKQGGSQALSLFDDSQSNMNRFAVNNDYNEDDSPLNLYSEQEVQNSSNSKAEPMMKPLFEEDVEVGMFSPKLNDIATVIKTTWKLMKRK